MDKKQLKQLQREWNKKLKDSGFRDIERWSTTGNAHNSAMLDDLNRNASRDNIVGKEEKFRVIGIYANNYYELSAKMRKILHLYANECNLTEAVKRVDPTINYNTVKSFIHNNFPKMVEFVRKLDEKES